MDQSTQALLLPAIIVISGLPILIAAVLVARGNLHLLNGLDASRLRDPAAAAARFARLLALMAIAIFVSALGYYWAHGNDGRMLWVTVALLVAVNGLAVALMLALARAKRDYRQPRDDERTGRR
ncbi:hypothetical protein ASE35_01550 [Lysobacter sp. Root916]|uniref:hypothetical protein n=1 Tax=Lysobacter sp. Root916 TaxID=1736606 RepID=UPI000708A118|nr:hypothetical protein [Lysobacter sp. Root916]KRD39086.1 hypothetical protein ASE35_01550 [Lysobacter sp. Root916]